jgi:hypothetical protein
MVNVRVEASRERAAAVTDRQTMRRGDLYQLAVLDGVLEETTEEERQALAGLDGSPSMRFIAYHNFLLRPRDRLKVADVKERWRERYGHLSGAEYIVLSATNSFRGVVAFLGPAQAAGF